MKILCNGCGKKKTVIPNSIKDKDNYHCKDCHGKLMKEKFSNPETRPICDRSALKKIEYLAQLRIERLKN